MSSVSYVKSGDATLAVRIDGSPGLPWLVLSNSLATSMAMWDDQMEVLTKLRRVVRYDTRGHGDSSAPPGPYDFAMLVRDVIAIMDHLEIKIADVMGLSLGGMTALGVGLDHPDRVRRVICCNARDAFPLPAIAMWNERIRAVKAGGLAAIADETLGRWFTEQTRKERPAIPERARIMILRTSVAGYCGCAAALKQLDYRRRLPDMQKPTHYVAAAADGAAPPDVMQELAKATPRATFAIVPAAAHISNMEEPAAFNAAIAACISS